MKQLFCAMRNGFGILILAGLLMGNSGFSQSVVSSVVPSNTTPNPGDTVTVAIHFDMTGITEVLGSFTGNLAWNPAKLQYLSNSGILAGFTGFVNDLNAANGTIIFNGAKALGQGGTFDVLILKFLAGEPGTTVIDLNYTAMAAAFTFVNLLPFLTVNDATITVLNPVNSVVSSVLPPDTTLSSGQTLLVRIHFDMTGMNPPNHNLGSFTGRLVWNPAVLQYVSNSGILSGFTGFVNDLNAATGLIIFNGAKALGQAGAFVVLELTFTAANVAATASTTIDLNYTAMAAAFTFIDLLPFLTINDANVTVEPIVGIGNEPLEPVTTFDLFQNFPNPFNPETVISYQLPAPANVELTIFNLLGQPVRTLVQEPQASGRYQVKWDGRNENGIAVASGLYLYRLRAGSFVETRKMMLMR